MSRVIIFLGLLLSCIAASADVRKSQRFDSPALGHELVYSVYLPPDYEQHPERRYPVVYLLHGVGDNEQTWLKAGKVTATMDRLLNSGELPAMIIVMPAAKISWYADSADVDGPGNYATAVREDLISHIDANYRTIAERSGRAIAGNSMGGFGALRLAFERPDLYIASAGLSSALWLHLRDDSVLSESQEKIFRGAFGTPFDAGRFLRQSPIAYFDNVKAFPGRLGIYLLAGDDDYFAAYRSTASLYTMLRDANIKAELRVGDGGHNWQYWASALPEVLRYFAQEFNRAMEPEATVTKTQTLPDVTQSRSASLATVVVPDDSADIAAAVASLPAHGGTVWVKAQQACYTIQDTIHIDRSNISLLGGQGTTLCLGDRVRQPIVLIGSAARSVPVSAHIENIRVSGFVIDGNREQQGDDNSAEDALGRPHLKNNAISIHGAKNVFLNNLILQNARSGGLVISQQSRAIFISDVVFAHNYFDGIAVDGGHEVFLNNFKAEHNLGSGVSIDTGSSELHISNGLIRFNGHNGIFVRQTTNSRFRSLSIENNCRYGVFASHVDDGKKVPDSGVSELFFSDLDLLRNGEAGFYYGSNSADPFLSRNNAIHSSRIGGNVTGGIIGDSKGVDELYKDNLILHGFAPAGPQDNILCRQN